MVIKWPHNVDKQGWKRLELGTHPLPIHYKNITRATDHYMSAQVRAIWKVEGSTSIFILTKSRYGQSQSPSPIIVEITTKNKIIK